MSDAFAGEEQLRAAWCWGAAAQGDTCRDAAGAA